MINKILFILLMAFSGCSKKTITKEACEELSMKKFRGYPDAAFKFKKHCQKLNIYYTQQRCQKALENYIINGDTEQLKKNFGSKILKCFNKHDLSKYNQQKVELPK